MKAYKSVIATTILTTLFLIGGGTVAAYADEGTPTESQEVASSPESTVATTDSSTSLSTEPTTTPTVENSQVPTPTSTEDSPAAEPSVEPSQPTASPDGGGTSPMAPEATPDASGGLKLNTPTTENPVAASRGHTPILICHKGYQDLTVDDNAVAAHLSHGDTLGACHPLTGGGPAPYPEGSDQIEIWWAMPWPGNAQNVTWPQAYASSTNLQCSITYQVDTYLKSEAQKFTLDGVLNLGEDYQNDTQRGAISWRFVYGGDCSDGIPPKPDDTRRLLDSHDTTDCEGKTVTHIETYEVTTYVYNDQHMTWVANIGPVTTETPREATEEECPVNTPLPTDTDSPSTAPITQPSATSGPASQSISGTRASTLPSVVASQPTRSLAKTGDNGALIAFLVALGVLLLVMGTAAVISTRRHN